MTSDRDRIDDVFDLLTGPDRHVLDHFAYYGLNPRNALRYADLSGVDFSGRDLTGFDFTGANLEGAKFEDANIFGVNFADAKLDFGTTNSSRNRIFCIPPKIDLGDLNSGNILSEIARVAFYANNEVFSDVNHLINVCKLFLCQERGLFCINIGDNGRVVSFDKEKGHVLSSIMGVDRRSNTKIGSHLEGSLENSLISTKTKIRVIDQLWRTHNEFKLVGGLASAGYTKNLKEVESFKFLYRIIENKVFIFDSNFGDDDFEDAVLRFISNHTKIETIYLRGDEFSYMVGIARFMV